MAIPSSAATRPGGSSREDREVLGRGSGHVADCAFCARCGPATTGPGPCASAVRSVPNPSHPSQTVWVYQPQGSGRPRVGGTCGDSSRPVVLLTHSWSATDPAGYGETIGHLVSNGHIVVFPNFTTSFDPPVMANQVDAGRETPAQHIRPCESPTVRGWCVPRGTDHGYHLVCGMAGPAWAKGTCGRDKGASTTPNRGASHPARPTVLVA